MFISIFKNRIKTFGIVMGITLFLALIVYYICYISGNLQIALPLAIIISVSTSLISYFNCDKMVLSISGARPADKATDASVRDSLERLCVAANLPVPKLYIVQDNAANAFATGRNPKNAVVCVTTGLLAKLDDDEIEGVLAHELAHIGNRDILLSTVVTVMVGIAVIVSDMWYRSMYWTRLRQRENNKNSNGFTAIISLVLMIVAPIAGQLMKMALSRNREYLADATAVSFTKNPNGLINALKKLGGETESVQRATNATANLYISNPLKYVNGKKPSRLFSTHPPITDRIEALKKLA